MENAKFTDRNQCLSCGGSDLSPIHSEANTPIPKLESYLQENPVLVQCQNCKLAFVKKIPANNEFYSQLYADSDRDVSIDFLYSGKKLIFKQIRDVLLKYTQGKPTLVDIGAGTGAFINSVRSHFTVRGVELSTACSAYARQKGLDVKTGSISDLLQENKLYDVVTLIDVLEHLADPKDAVASCAQILKPGGIIFIKVPNYQFQLIKQKLLIALKLSKEGIMQNFVHINHFTPDSLKILLEKNGFGVLEFGATPAEIWDLSWKDAPKSQFYRFNYNWVVQTVTTAFGFKHTNLNFYMVGKKL